MEALDKGAGAEVRLNDSSHMTLQTYNGFVCRTPCSGFK